MRKYETLMVLHPDLPDAQTRETIGRARRLIEDMGGKVDQVQEWGMRDLAYPIRKLSRGYYVLTEYTATPETVNELERNLKIADEILRFLTVVPAADSRPAKPAVGGLESGDSEGETADGDEDELEDDTDGGEAAPVD